MAEASTGSLGMVASRLDSMKPARDPRYHPSCIRSEYVRDVITGRTWCHITGKESYRRVHSREADQG